MAKKTEPLTKTHPEISKEWDYELNNGLTPDQVSKGCHKKVYWKCPKGHPSYPMRISNRTYNDEGCPVCGDRKVLAGYNDLATTNPFIAKQWDYENNFPKTPQEIFKCEGNSYYWICPICSNHYKASVSNRVAGKGCKKCSKTGTSFPEQAIYYYIKQIFTDAVNRDTSLGIELDIYIPSIKTAIEYDGVAYHNSDESLIKDNNKDQICRDNGIILYRFRDPVLKNTLYATRITCEDKRGNCIQPGIQELLSLLKHGDIDVDVDRDYFEIVASAVSYKKKNSILFTHPLMAAEWHPTKNLPLTPDCVTSGMAINAWWICSKHKETYRAYVYSRKNSNGCPKCSIEIRSKKHSETAAKKNNFALKYPHLAAEILIDNHPGLDINRLPAGSDTELWWRCSKCGKIWPARITERVRGRGCPKCGREKASQAAKRAVVNVTTGITYDSLTEAAASCNGDKKRICACCQGRQKTAYGYKWKYLNESNRKSKEIGKRIHNIEKDEIFPTIQAAADKYGCSRSSISGALRGKTKTSQGCHWEFIDSDTGL